MRKKIAVFSIDGAGKISKQSEVAAPGGPSVGNDGRVLYKGQRRSAGDHDLSDRSQIRRSRGPAGTNAQVHAPAFFAPDRSSRFSG
jgi:hypothetical protein